MTWQSARVMGIVTSKDYESQVGGSHRPATEGLKDYYLRDTLRLPAGNLGSMHPPVLLVLIVHNCHSSNGWRGLSPSGQGLLENERRHANGMEDYGYVD